MILPVLLLLLAVFLRWGLMLRDDLRDTAEYGREVESAGTPTQGRQPTVNIGFLHGGQPARRIRDADYVIDLGYSIIERLPAWIQK